MMRTEINFKKWINHHINQLQKQARWSKIKDFFWTSLLLIIQVSTVAVAAIALIYLFLNTPSDQLKLSFENLSLIFTIISLTFIILTFFLQIFNKIYTSRMRDKAYQLAINHLKVEIARYNSKQGDYATLDGQKKFEEVLAKIDADILAFQNVKLKYRQAFVSTATSRK